MVILRVTWIHRRFRFLCDFGINYFLVEFLVSHYTSTSKNSMPHQRSIIINSIYHFQCFKTNLSHLSWLLTNLFRFRNHILLKLLHFLLKFWILNLFINFPNGIPSDFSCFMVAGYKECLDLFNRIIGIGNLSRINWLTLIILQNLLLHICFLNLFISNSDHLYIWVIF